MKWKEQHLPHNVVERGKLAETAASTQVPLSNMGQITSGEILEHCHLYSEHLNALLVLSRIGQ